MKKEYFVSAAAVLSAFSLLLSGCSGASHNAAVTDGFPLTQQTVGNKSPESESSESADSSVSQRLTAPTRLPTLQARRSLSQFPPLTLLKIPGRKHLWNAR